MQTPQRMPPVICSRDNKKLKDLKHLTLPEGIKKAGRTIVSGPKLVREAVCRFPDRCRSLIIPEHFMQDCPETAALMETFSGRRSLVVFKKGLFADLDLFQTGGPLLEITCPDINRWDGTLPAQGCTLLIPFQDPVNVGTAVRSAAAFGVRHCVLAREAAVPYHPKSIRSSGGAVFLVTFYRGPSLAREGEALARLAPYIVSLDMSGVPIQRFSFPDAFLLLPGMEGQGLPQAWRSRAVAIPMEAGVESLNGSVAASIFLFYWKMGRKG